jgi:hypothetical protein
MPEIKILQDKFAAKTFKVERFRWFFATSPENPQER